MILRAATSHETLAGARRAYHLYRGGITGTIAMSVCSQPAAHTGYHLLDRCIGRHARHSPLRAPLSSPHGMQPAKIAHCH